MSTPPVTASPGTPTTTRRTLRAGVAACSPWVCAIPSGSPSTRRRVACSSATPVGTRGRSTTSPVPGSNFGWPCWEGTGHTGGYETTSFCADQYATNARHDAPLYTYPHNGVGAVAVGGVFTGTGSSYPAAYRGVYFMGDYARGTISVLRPDNNDQLTAPVEAFGSNIGAPVDFQLDPASGDVVYADIVSGDLVRIKYAAGNRAPFAAAAQDESRSNPDQLIAAFDASGSYDLDGDPLTYSWNFGDGKSGTGIAPVHQYASAAPVTVTLTVSDGRATGTATLKVSPANHPPHLSVTSCNPPARRPVRGRRSHPLSATATDVEDGNLTSSITGSRYCCIARLAVRATSIRTSPDQAAPSTTHSAITVATPRWCSPRP